jgi:hypothetical protein
MDPSKTWRNDVVHKITEEGLRKGLEDALEAYKALPDTLSASQVEGRKWRYAIERGLREDLMRALDGEDEG